MAGMHAVLVGLVGAFTGLVGGLFGKGGSAIATPLLNAVGVKPFEALASPLPATIPATLVAAFAYGRAGEIDRRVLRTVLTLGLPATVVGALCSAVIGGGALVTACDVIVAALGVRILTARPADDRVLVAAGNHAADVADPLGEGGPAHPDDDLDDRRVGAVAVGVGLVSGLLANSGGFLLAPLFMTALRMPLKRALGTSLAAAAVLAVPGTIVHAALGHVAWSVAVPFGLASVPLSAVGARIALRADAGRLEVLYGAVLLLLGVSLLIIR